MLGVDCGFDGGRGLADKGFEVVGGLVEGDEGGTVRIDVDAVLVDGPDGVAVGRRRAAVKFGKRQGLGHC